MALDHFVPQVHLRKWLSSDSQLLNAIRKTDLKTFMPGTKTVCAIQGGSTNLYVVEEERLVEKYLEDYEPRYNDAVERISRGSIDFDAVQTIAGLVSCISSCSPTAGRLHTNFLKESVKTTASILERQGKLPPLNGMGITEMIERGLCEIAIDSSYPQSFGIRNVEKTTEIFTLCEWDIIHNPFCDSAFFTSDYPIGLERSKNFKQINNKIIPLTPEVVVRIKPDLDVKERLGGRPSGIKFRMHRATRKEVVYINRILIRSAEDTLFYKNQQDWIRTFVEKNRNYRIEGVVYTGRQQNEHAILCNQQIVRYEQSKAKKIAPPRDGWFEFRVTESE